VRITHKVKGLGSLFVDTTRTALLTWNLSFIFRNESVSSIRFLLPDGNRSPASHIQLFRERLSEKSIKVHMTRPKGGLGIHWNFTYWPRGNLQVCIFARGEFVFPLRRLYFYCRMSLSEKNSSKLQRGKRTLFLHVWKERKTEFRAYFVVILISIQHVQ